MSAITASQKRIFKTLLAIIPLLFGVAVAKIYFDFIQPSYPQYSLGLFKHKEDIAGMVLSFAFTMLGFLAAIITLLFGFTEKESYKKFKRNGYLDILFFLYLISIVCLIITAFLAMFSYSETKFVFIFRTMLVFFVANIIQVGIITFVISIFCKKSDGTT